MKISKFHLEHLQKLMQQDCFTLPNPRSLDREKRMYYSILQTFNYLVNNPDKKVLLATTDIAKYSKTFEEITSQKLYNKQANKLGYYISLKAIQA
jgi:1,6-anhydro-N-acetylmuramate kinase